MKGKNSMLNKIKTSFLQLSALTLLTFFGFTGLVAAQNPNPQDSLCTGADGLQLTTSPNAGSCAASGEGAEEGLNSLIADIINIFSVIVGIVAVIMIIYGGFRYITSGGDSGNITTAKNTILYAIIGLVIVARAQFIVRFVLSQATDVSS